MIKNNHFKAVFIGMVLFGSSVFCSLRKEMFLSKLKQEKKDNKPAQIDLYKLPSKMPLPSSKRSLVQKVGSKKEKSDTQATIERVINNDDTASLMTLVQENPEYFLYALQQSILQDKPLEIIKELINNMDQAIGLRQKNKIDDPILIVLGRLFNNDPLHEQTEKEIKLLAIMKFIIDKNYSVINESNGIPPLVWVIQYKKIPLIYLLLSNVRTDVRKKDMYNNTAFSLILDLLIQQRHVRLLSPEQKKWWAIMQLLLDRDPGIINELDELGRTPLMKAAHLCDLKLVRFLLDNGADSTIQNKLGLTSLDLAQKNKEDPKQCNEVIAMLERNIKKIKNPSKLDVTEQFPRLARITQTIRDKDISLLSLLNNPKATRLKKDTIALGLAQKIGNQLLSTLNYKEFIILQSEFFKFIKKYKFELSPHIAMQIKRYFYRKVHEYQEAVTDEEKEKFLFYFIERANDDSSENLQFILDGNVNVNARNPIMGNTPLMIAALHNKPNFAGLLLEYGADPNAQNINGDTALMFAIYRNSENAVIVILNPPYIAIDFSKKNNEGKDVFDLAKAKNHPGIQRSLKLREID